MKRHGNANAWLLGILVFILGLIGIDVGRQFVANAKPHVDSKEEKERNDPNPPFKVGDVAPDFVLNDEAGKKHALSELVHKDTLLAFTCGCNNCKQMLTFFGKMRAQMGEKAPDVVNITSMPPEATGAWVRDTKLPQKFLCEVHQGPELQEEQKEFKGKTPMDYYKGHPCPRLFRVDSDRKLTWISGSPNQYEASPIGMQMMEIDLGHAMGFRLAKETDAKNAGKPVMPSTQGNAKADASKLPPSKITPIATDISGLKHP